MKKINLIALMRKEASFRLPKFIDSAYTLAEVIIVMLIIAVIVAVSIGITKAKLDNIVSYTYYNAYSSLRKISTEMLADWDPTDPEYKEALLENNLAKNNQSSKFFKNVFSLNNFFTPAYAIRKPPSQSIDQFMCIDGVRPTYCFDTGVNVCPPSKCPVKCPNGSLSYSGNCFVSCWDGSTASSSSACPPKIKCWDGSYATSSSKCPKATCWNGSTASEPSLCPAKITCWDGSFETKESDCPGYVTCWNGSKAYNYSGCPACTNKPDPLPCGQGWDEKTCTLTGTVKSCPSGQHLNSGCQCVVDCPTDLSICKRCDAETGVISQNPDVNRSCTDETYEWSEEQCKCIPSPRTLPRKGDNFCKLLDRHSNSMGDSGICSGSVVPDNTTNFADKKPNMVLSNGLRIYNLHKDAAPIDALAGNTQGGVYDGVPNTNSYGYTVYVDIDGAKGDSLLWSDVYPFYITLSGKIIPAYDKANPGVSGGDSTRHLQVSVQYEDYSSGHRRIKWLSKSTSFKEGACLSGYVGDATPYCKDAGAVTKLSECTTDGNSMCNVKQIQPVKFFF